jgi:hypothetical protein
MRLCKWFLEVTEWKLENWICRIFPNVFVSCDTETVFKATNFFLWEIRNCDLMLSSSSLEIFVLQLTNN